MPANIVLSTLTPSPPVLAQNPLGSTHPDMYDGTRDGGYVPPSDNLIFSVNFNDWDDWHSGLPQNNISTTDGANPDREQRRGVHTMPPNIEMVRQNPLWAPSTGYPDRRECFSVLASDIAEFSHNGTDKVLVVKRDSGTPGSNGWNSDSMGMWDLADFTPDGALGVDEIYVEFYIMFGSNWTPWSSGISGLGGSKLFRITAWNGQEPLSRFFSDGNHGPIAIWNWHDNQYGLRNFLAFRGGPWSDNYGMENSMMPDKPINFVAGSSGDLDMNFAVHIAGMGPNGSTPQIPDLVNGGYIPNTTGVGHARIYGNNVWHKMGFYAKMNSAPGVADGEFAQWFDGKRTFVSKGINWCPTGINGTDEMPLWRIVDLSGNDNFNVYPTADRREEPYAFHSLRVFGSRPSFLEWDDE